MCYEAGLLVFELEGRFIVTFESDLVNVGACLFRMMM